MIRALRDPVNPFLISFGSGGGAAAGNETPEYLQGAHKQMISGSNVYGIADDYLDNTFLFSVMEDLIETNESPYNGEVSYDPDTDIAAALVETQAFDDQVDALNPVTDFNTRHSNAVTKSADIAFSSLATAINLAVASATAALSEAAISSAITAYRSSVEARLATRLSELSGAAADINAVHSSAFILAEALIDAEVEKDINLFESQIKLESFKDLLRGQIEVIVRKELAKDQYISTAVSEMNRLALAGLDAAKVNAGLFQDFYKFKIVAKKEESRENLELDVNDALWDMEIFQRGSNVIASAFGASTLTEPKMSPFRSALSGLSGGASAGAAIGSVIPGVGTAIGAGVGGAIGLAGGLFG